jgi:3-oxoadipate enol-lactonase
MMKYLTLGELKFFYQDLGTGFPVVMVHGMGSDHTVWDGILPYLKENYRVLAVDLRGHGKSSKTPGPYSIKLFSNDIKQFIEALDIDQAHFIGHSMGGAIIQELTLQNPGKINSLTLISSFAYIDSHLQEILMNLLKIVSNDGYNAFFDACLKLANTPEFIEKNKELFRIIRDSNGQIISIPAITDTINACLNIDFRSSLKNITNPTMIIAGKNDIFTPPYHGIKIKNMISNSKIEIMNDTCHNLILEKPYDTYLIINRFLDIYNPSKDL